MFPLTREYLTTSMGASYGSRVIGHPKGIIRLGLSVGARDIEGCDAMFEIDFHNWKTFHVRRLDQSQEPTAT
jgi:hypothetical protein